MNDMTEVDLIYSCQSNNTTIIGKIVRQVNSELGEILKILVG
jgi:hypothetical protein